MISSPQTILTVDDSLTIRKLIENALRPTGYEVLQAASGEEGLRMARERRPDLILLDYVLPDLRGVEFCHRLLADPETRDMPVLLISGHGSAIQELSHDCANVVDYLTKPFASNILLAVVTSVFEKAAARRDAPPAAVEAAPTPASPEAAAMNGSAPHARNGSTRPARGSVVTQPKSLSAPGGLTAPAAPATLDVELRRRVFEKLVARLHAALPSIPAWEAARAGGEPLSYYLSRLVPLDLVDELAAELAGTASRAASSSASGGDISLRGSTRFVSERHVLTHLHAENATGELRLKLPEETVTLWLDGGVIVAISSDHPRFYCAGSDYPFLQVPHAAVSAAMLAQREAGVPFFVTAAARGVRLDGVDLPRLLRDSGHRCMLRVYAAGECVFSFRPLLPEALPAHARGDYRIEFSLPQLLLESYRSVSDWQHVQQAVPRLELYVGRTSFDDAYLQHLRLDTLEAELLSRMDFRHTVAQLQEIVARPLFEVCRAIYCLARLDLCYLSDLPMLEDEPPVPGQASEVLPAHHAPREEASNSVTTAGVSP